MALGNLDEVCVNYLTLSPSASKKKRKKKKKEKLPAHYFLFSQNFHGPKNMIYIYSIYIYRKKYFYGKSIFKLWKSIFIKYFFHKLSM